MLNNNLNLEDLTKTELLELYYEVLQQKLELEQNSVNFDRQMNKSKKRTIDVFGKMIDQKKMQRIISWQNDELKSKTEELEKQRKGAERTYQKFRERTIDLFGKMIDLKKANKIIQQQNLEIENQRKQLHEINASKDKFFSILAHDLKNPIAGFLGLTELMATKMEELSPEVQQTFVDSLYDSSKNLYSLLENLLQWARAQTGSLKLHKKEHDAYRLIYLAINQVATNAKLKNITINKPDFVAINVYADQDTMITILRNLLSNAVKFSQPNGIIDIALRSENKQALISITDYGIGIAPDKIGNLFRIDKTISQKGTAEETGTGLGLILCKEFIELNGGTIRVESILNERTTFSIKVPMFEE